MFNTSGDPTAQMVTISLHLAKGMESWAIGGDSLVENNRIVHDQGRVRGVPDAAMRSCLEANVSKEDILHRNDNQLCYFCGNALRGGTVMPHTFWFCTHNIAEIQEVEARLTARDQEQGASALVIRKARQMRVARSSMMILLTTNPLNANLPAVIRETRGTNLPRNLITGRAGDCQPDMAYAPLPTATHLHHLVSITREIGTPVPCCTPHKTREHAPPPLAQLGRVGGVKVWQGRTIASGPRYWEQGSLTKSASQVVRRSTQCCPPSRQGPRGLHQRRTSHG